MSNTTIRNMYDLYLDNGQIEFVTFHPSYSYEDFIESIRPNLESEGGNQRFISHTGIFKQICLNAINSIFRALDLDEIASWSDFKPQELKGELREQLQKNPDFLNSIDRYVLIIDEINRGDISKIFGELISLIEEDKRIGAENEIIVTLPYTKNKFGVPPNLYIVGTMNTADRSLTSIDIALRRRFQFEEMSPKFDKLLENPKEFNISCDVEDLRNSIAASIKINEKLAKNPDIGRDKRIGHAFFCNISKNSQIESAWINKIWPLLEEYYYFDKEALKELSGATYTPESGWDKNQLENFLKKINE